MVVAIWQFAAAQDVNVCKNVTEIPKVECEALVALYNYTNGNEWVNKRGWLTTDFPCSWRGVECHDGHVTILKLSANNLNGRIPSELGSLARLRWLNLKHNHLRANIPSELGNLAMLEWLDLSFNGLNGDIPPELSMLSKLVYLNLFRNQLKGRIPSELGTLTHLTYLNLSDNQLCRPEDVTFQAWLQNLGLSENTYELCSSNRPSSPSSSLNLSSLSNLPGYYVNWLSVFAIILGVSWLALGIMIGLYTSLKQIYGTSYTYLFGYSRDNNKTIRITGILNRIVLMGGLFSILAGLCCLVVVSYEKADEAIVFPGILFGTIVGVLYSWKENIWKTRDGTDDVKKEFQGNILDYIKITWKTGGGLIIAGIFIGIITGALTVTLFGEMTGNAAGKIAGGISSIIVAGIAGFFGGRASTMTGWFPGGIFGGIVGGIAGHTVYYRIPQFLTFSLMGENRFVEGIVMGIFGVLSGIISGYISGILLSLVAGVLTKIMILLVEIMNTLVSAVMNPLLIVLKFATIICDNCFRYTKPLNSHYEDGIRYCEHCNKPVEYTREPGKVRLAFGEFSKFQLRKMQSGERRFLLVNPDFDQNNNRIDVSRVYLDTETCDRLLFEGFIIYIINSPPKNGLQSVQMFHHGELEELGDNLKNTLQNNFKYIERVD